MKNALELKILPPLAMLICAGLIHIIAQVLPVSTMLLDYREGLTGFFIILGLSIDLFAIVLFLREKTTGNPFVPHESTALVTSGVYRITRNPMYIGLICLLLAWTIWLGCFFGLLLIALFQQYITHFQIMPEERSLQTLFGKAYDDYCAQVRRWI